MTDSELSLQTIPEGFKLIKRTGPFSRWFELTDDDMHDLHTIMTTWKEGLT